MACKLCVLRVRDHCSLRQVDLQFLKVLTGIATQGAVSKETQKSYYVTNFKLEVSTNGEDWMVYRHGKNHKVGAEDRVLSAYVLSPTKCLHFSPTRQPVSCVGRIARIPALLPVFLNLSHAVMRWGSG